MINLVKNFEEELILNFTKIWGTTWRTKHIF